MTVRDMLNGVNQAANTVIDADVSIRTALVILTSGNAAISKASTLLSLCDNIRPDDDYTRCMDRQAALADVYVREATKNWPTENSTDTKNKNPYWRKAIVARRKWLLEQPKKQEAARVASAGQSAGSTPAPSASPAPSTSPSPSASNSPAPSASPSPSASNSPAPTLTPVNNGSGFAPAFTIEENDVAGFEHIISSFATSFLYIIEVMMLVTGLVGPVFLAMSMFPVATKPVISWAISFLSFGFCKICFTLISGLSAIAMVYAGPDQDMLVASVVLGLLAPVLSFGVASGTGLSALNSVGMISQNFGMNTGAAYGTVPGVPGGLPPKTDG
jgi:hypothetical protein